MRFLRQWLCAAAVAAVWSVGSAPAVHGADGYSVNYAAEAVVNAGCGDFAPYYIASNRHGVLTQSKNALLRLSAWRGMNRSDRFSYGFGADFIGGYGSDARYLRWSDGALRQHSEHPSRVWVQQLYGEVKYRSLFLTAGLKEHTSALLDFSLSSGDLVESGNARPIPEVRIGFIDFQDIPFTNGWVQIQGEISYGKLTDNGWMRDHYNYFQSHLNLGALYTYKRCYFRTDPTKRFSATVGMQVGAFFGGSTSWYYKGEARKSETYSRGLKQFFKMLLPTDGGQEYYAGSSLGSWDILLRYELGNGMTLRGYLQKPWEDGSGIGFLNGFDGLWGVELKTNRPGIVTGAVVEYLDFTNQSGAIHWDPDDNPGTGIKHRAEGADDYYNNHEYNSYANYGMSIGTPFLKSPLYNLDGCMMYLHNRVRGFHIGVEGEIGKVGYRVLGGYRKSWGAGYQPVVDPAGDTSMLFEASYRMPRINGLLLKAQAAFDKGTLYGDNFGACLTISYRGALNL